MLEYRWRGRDFLMLKKKKKNLKETQVQQSIAQNIQLTMQIAHKIL